MNRKQMTKALLGVNVVVPTGTSTDEMRELCFQHGVLERPANTETANTETANTETANTETANTETANTETANTETANTETGDEANTAEGEAVVVHTPGEADTFHVVLPETGENTETGDEPANTDEPANVVDNEAVEKVRATITGKIAARETPDRANAVRRLMKAGMTAVDADRLFDEVSARASENPPKRGSIVPPEFKARYGSDQHCGDELAVVMKDQCTAADGSCDLVEIARIADQNGIDISRWDHLNPGQQRMNLGNVLRNRLVKGEPVTVGLFSWNVPEHVNPDLPDLAAKKKAAIAARKAERDAAIAAKKLAKAA